jgi:hypothetical protein
MYPASKSFRAERDMFESDSSVPEVEVALHSEANDIGSKGWMLAVSAAQAPQGCQQVLPFPLRIELERLAWAPGG